MYGLDQPAAALGPTAFREPNACRASSRSVVCSAMRSVGRRRYFSSSGDHAHGSPFEHAGARPVDRQVDGKGRRSCRRVERWFGQKYSSSFTWTGDPHDPPSCFDVSLFHEAPGLG